MQKIELKGSATKTDYDIIVIGTGMGGSAAGAICALNGLKTLILEKNPRPGGACSYYEKEGFQIDTGTHLFIRGNKGPFGECTKRLGMGTPINFIKIENTVHFKGINVNIIIPRSIFGIILRMIGPRALLQVKIHPKHYFGLMKLGIDILLMKEHEMRALNDITVLEFMQRYTDDESMLYLISGLLGLFFIIPPWEASAGESIWNLRRLFFEYNLGYPKGGCVKIPSTFLKGAESHGAQVRLNANVKKINIKEGKVTGVTMDNGEKISAAAVISTSNVSDTVELFTGPEYYPKEYVQMVKSIKPSWTAVQAKIGLNKKLVKAGSMVGAVPLKLKGGLNGFIIEDYFKKLEAGKFPDIMPIYAPVPSNYDPGLAPKGCQLMTVVGCAPTLDVKLDHDPKLWIDKMMDAVRQMVPGIDKHMIFCDTWSVQTLADWIGKSNGSAITTSQNPNQVGFRRPPHETPVKGLYIAGDCAGQARGVGTELACQSGMDCADLVSSHIVNKML